eukprot:1671264-Pyramimonas_sp.AAC.1
MEVNGPTDQQLRADLNTSRSQVEMTAATLHSRRTTLTSELHGKLRCAEMAIVQGLDASEGRVPTLENRVSTVEQQLTDVRTALAELRVARAQTDQLGTPTS